MVRLQNITRASSMTRTEQGNQDAPQSNENNMNHLTKTRVSHKAQRFSINWNALRVKKRHEFTHMKFINFTSR